MDEELNSLLYILVSYLIIVLIFLLFCYIYTICYYIKRDLPHFEMFVITNLENANNISDNNENLKDDCCICLFPMEHNLTISKCCKNTFHNKCLVDYIIHKHIHREDITCPMCRKII